MATTPKDDPPAPETEDADDLFGSPEPEPLTAFDLDLRAETEPDVKTITVRTADGDLVVPRSMDDWTGEAINLMTEGKFRDALLEVCSEDEDQLKVIKALTIGMINKVMDHIIKIAGITPGESGRSGASSRRTGRKPRRT